MSGDGVEKARESLDELRDSCGVCGDNDGVESQLELEEARECTDESDSSSGTLACDPSPLSLSSDVMDMQFLPSIM